MVLFLAAAGLGPACSRRPSARAAFPGAPVILVSIDTLRSDHLPAYGYTSGETPAIDRLRHDALLCRRAYAHVPLTLPSHLSMLTGQLPFEHQVRDNLGYHFDAKAHPTLPQMLRGRGYATGAAVSAYVLRGGTGLAESFDFYDDRLEAGPGVDVAGEVQREGGQTAAALLGWIATVKERPFFAFLHLYEPHSPYDPPSPFRRPGRSAYDGEISAADAIAGTFLDRLREWGLYDRAIIALVSDHGEGLGDHGEDFHGIFLYREALQVPFLLKLPGSARAGNTVDRVVGLVDLLPTLAALAGLPPTPNLRGRSVLEDAGPDGLYAETQYPRIHLGWSDLHSLLDARYHFIQAPEPELYDLVQDPEERHDLARAQPGTAAALGRALGAHGAAYAAPAAVSAEDLERLRALGYLSGATAPAPEVDQRLPDPKAQVHLLADLKTAFQLEAAGQLTAAAAALQRLLAANPRLFDAQYELGQVLGKQERWAEAERVYRTAIESSPGFAHVIALPLARVCLQLGKLSQAEANADLAAATSAGQAHEIRARVALARDDLARAETELAQAAGDPTAERNRAVLQAEIHIRRAELPQALTLLEEARRRIEARKEPPLRDLHFLRGDVLARQGRKSQAESAFREEIAAFPGNSPAYARLAIVLALEGRRVAEVNAVLEEMVRARPVPESYDLAARTLESMGDHRRAEDWRRRRPSGHP